MKYKFGPKAFKEIKKLPKLDRERIVNKLDFCVSQEDPIYFAEKLSNLEIGDYRFRIGSYRVAFEISDGDIRILKVGHRREIYK